MKKNSKDKSGRSSPKKGRDAGNKSHNLRNSLTSSPLNTGLDLTGKSNIRKPPSKKLRLTSTPLNSGSDPTCKPDIKKPPGKKLTWIIGRTKPVSKKIINKLPKIFRCCSYDACKMITPQSAKFIKKWSTYGCGKFVHRACQEQFLMLNNCEEDGTAPGSFCQGCFTLRAKEFASKKNQEPMNQKLMM